jgi:hypothetical protein
VAGWRSPDIQKGTIMISLADQLAAAQREVRGRERFAQARGL